MLINIGVAAYLCLLMIILGLVCAIGTMYQNRQGANGADASGKASDATGRK
jgi:uncharacterized membrane protein YhaH (DUF805 family)